LQLVSGIVSLYRSSSLEGVAVGVEVDDRSGNHS